MFLHIMTGKNTIRYGTHPHDLTPKHDLLDLGHYIGLFVHSTVGYYNDCHDDYHTIATNRYRKLPPIFRWIFCAIPVLFPMFKHDRFDQTNHTDLGSWRLLKAWLNFYLAKKIMRIDECHIIYHHFVIFILSRCHFFFQGC